ncbi:hypothetical protein BJX68DRAFT_198852 [Aspergillus pseudodeflectus]|uniref:Uncharacterized protein n=1 Tax=Aspergillus pseudodeflectus TaxID=176178 RepID=A0ABR4JHJ3_9EURO
MYACLTSMFVPLPVAVLLSIRNKDPFDWDEFFTIERVSDKQATEDEDEDTEGTANNARNTHTHHFNKETYFTPDRVAYMKRMSRIAAIWAVATFLGQIVLWPLPMYGAKTVMSRGLFIAWVVVGIVWLFVTLLVANFYPLLDGGVVQIWEVVLAAKKSVLGKKKAGGEGEGSSDVEREAEVDEVIRIEAGQAKER